MHVIVGNVRERCLTRAKGMARVAEIRWPKECAPPIARQMQHRRRHARTVTGNVGSDCAREMKEMLSKERVAQFFTFGLLWALLLTACVRPLSDVGRDTDEAANENVNVAATVESSGEFSPEEAVAEEEVAAPEEPVVEEEVTEVATAEAPVVEEEPEVAETVEAVEVEATEEAPGVVEESAEAAAEEAEEVTTVEEVTEEEAVEEETAVAEAEEAEAVEAEAAETEAAEVAATTAETTHVVQAGENLYRIGLRYGLSWVTLAQYNNLPNASVVYVGQVLRIPGTGTPDTESPAETVSYTVRRGDTLFRIGQRFGVSWVEIAEANGIVNPNQIYPGQVLKIPASAPGPSPEFTHIVSRGETLYSIALRYGVRWLAVAEANGIQSPFVIYAGQTLVIPGS
jgi:LysM repeat protein